MPKHNTSAETMSIPVITNCPNCGAVIRGDECEYCGTVFRKQISEQTLSTAEFELYKSRKRFHDAPKEHNELCKQSHLDLVQALNSIKYGI